MTQQKFRSVVTMVALLIVAPARAQQPEPQQQPLSMSDTMKLCREHNQATSGSIDQMMKLMGEAERSNDPAKMRQILQDAQKRLTAMRQQMSSCMSMMDMMKGMQGGGAQGGMAMMGGGEGSAAGTSGMQGQQQPGGTGMSSGMACCMPGAGLHGAAAAAVIGLGALLALCVAAALIALTVFLWNRSRTVMAARA